MAESVEVLELEKELEGFCGSENLHEHVGLYVTDGIKYLADKAQAWWLVDVIASHQPTTRKLDFQLWEISKRPGNKAVVVCRADSGVEPTVRQEIAYTDFPIQHMKFYVRDGVLMLPSEY